MIGYKGFDENFKCRGFQYEVGGVYEMSEPIDICHSGFHFCLDLFSCFNFYSLKYSKFALIEAIGDVIVTKTKCCTNKIKIIKELTKEEIVEISNKGNDNYGIGNDGNENSGWGNLGNFNKGFCNVGNFNVGSKNNGYGNKGLCNEGELNCGVSNKGENNRGDWNNGDKNSGSNNIGTFNYGDSNVGDNNIGGFNIGDGNVGFFNVGNGITGMFGKPANINLKKLKENKAFNYLLSDMAANDKHNSNQHKWFFRPDHFDREAIKIPNFDIDILSKILGIEIFDFGIKS